MNSKLLNIINAAFCTCLMLFSANSIAQTNLDVTCPYDIKDFGPSGGKDCVYFLNLHDALADGWDGASVDISVGEAAAINYKVTVADGACKLVPIYVNDGETIDITYWNGANEVDHGMALYDATGNVATTTAGSGVDFLGNIPANQLMRVKAVCPNVPCLGDSEAWIVNIVTGTNPEEQSWEIYEGTPDQQGPQVIGINAAAYAGIAPGTVLPYSVTLERCKEYTFVAFDGANDGWAAGAWGVMTTNADYGTLTGSGLYRLIGGTGTADETRTGFTIPCASTCQDVSLVSADGNCLSLAAIDLPVAAPTVCYPACGHGTCGTITAEHFVVPFGSAGAGGESAPGGAGIGGAIGGPGASVGGAAPLVDDLPAGTGVLVAGPLTGSGAVIVSFPATNPYTGFLADTNGDGVLSPDADGDGISDVDTNGDGVIDALDAIDTPGVLPVGSHQYITEYTYCDGVVVRCTADLVIVSDANPSLTCNDNVIISLGAPSSSMLAECTVEVTPDMVLEMANFCENEYIVTVLAADGSSLGNTVGPDQLMQTLTYVVEHAISGNKCWGTLTVEDKLAPILVCNDYDVPCTHPNALEWDYSHNEVYSATAEMPANIAGGILGAVSNTFLPVNIGCTPNGEVVTSISVSLDVDHNDISDLSVVLHAPAALGIGSIDLGAVTGAQNVYTSATTSAPALSVLVGQQCSALMSTSPEDFVTETTNGVVPTNVGGTWYIQVIDADASTGGSNNPVGGGEVTAASINITCGFPFPYAAYDCSLEGVALINETVLETNCDQSDWNGSKIERVWQATDKYGRTSTCKQTVGLVAPTMDQISVPGDVSIECGTEQLDANGAIDPAQSGGPIFGCNAITQAHHGLCDVSFTYSDQKLPTCGNGYKVIRTWLVVNWCSGVNQEIEQIIKVEDTEGPTVAGGNITVGTSAYDCSADFGLTDLGITDACSGVNSATATYTQGGGAYAGSGTLVIVDLLSGGQIEDMPTGETVVKITAKDGCLNQTEVYITITVVDDTAPVAICDDQLHVSLGSDGTARLSAEDVDEGSYDNCSDVTLEVRRTDGCLGQTNWASTVPFECCDVDELVTVELRVTDGSGNSNVCWKTVLVEDALAPVITCAPDKTLDCDSPEVHAPFGEPTFLDNCTAEIISTVDGGELDQCKAGTLTRRWTVSDGSTKSQDASCTQRVTVNHVSDFIVQFPADVTLTGCALQDTGAPTLTDDDCELLAINSDDLVLTIVDDACYKIERTWTVINWCVYDQGNAANTDLGLPQPLPRTYQDDDGYFQYTQVIKVLDADAPTIPNPGDLEFCDLTEGCEGQADLTIFPSDDCSDFFSLEYTYKIDAFNDGSFDIVASGNDASGVYPYGTHLIKWIVEDGCGNASEISHLFTIKDCKNPTPVCLNGLSVPGMNSDGCVAIWASDLLEYAFDNCSSVDYVEGSVRIREAGTTGAPQSEITLCCADGLDTRLVEVWVEDEAGNADYCTTYVILQDPNGICDNNDGGGDDSRMIAGTIATEAVEMVEDVMVDIDGSNGMSTASPTGSNGSYAFSPLAAGVDYTVTPGKDINPLNGVSTYDLVLMSQHILGVAPLTSPYALIAADVNNDGNVTTFDVVQNRQMILYVIQDYPTNTSWRFVDADYVFPMATNPWFEAFPESIEVADLTQDEMLTDFVAVKVGDVNGDATPNSVVGAEERNLTGTLVLSIDDAELNAGNTANIEFRASDFDGINGYQFTMNFDAAAMQLTGVEGGALNITEGNFGLSMLNEGVITTSWNGTTTKVANDEVLFTLNFEITSAVVLSEAVNVNSRYTTAEAYAAGDLMDVALAFNTANGSVVSGGTFELYQNTPNPFNGESVIGFTLPTASAATLKIYDVAGKVLKVIEGDYARGYNQISINSANLDASGVLYYQLDTPAHSATKKMIIVD